MAKSKYRKYISTEIIEKSKYPQITAPMVKYRGDMGGSNMTFEWQCINKPLVMDDEPEVNDFDQYMFFSGGNLNDRNEFLAEVDLPLGKEGKKQTINSTTLVYIPSGLAHGPLKFKNVKKPIVFYSFSIAPKYSVKWDKSTNYGKYLAKDLKAETHRMKMGGMGMRYKWISRTGVMAFSDPLGFKGKLCMSYNSYTTPFDAWETVHYHNTIDEWLIYLGGNPLDVTDFDAEIEMWWGEELEKQVLDCTCVVHVPAGLVHYNNNHAVVNKPYTEVIATIVPRTGDYFKEGDRVALDKGDGYVVDSPEMSYTKGAKGMGKMQADTV